MIQLTKPNSRKGHLTTLLDTEFKFFTVSPNSTYSIPYFEGVAAPTMPIDIKDEGEHIVIWAELPGRRVEDLKIELDRNILLIESLCDKLDTNYNDFIVNERYLGTYKRAISLPDSINTNEINSDYKDGILTIRLPKLEKEKTTRIPIN